MRAVGALPFLVLLVASAASAQPPPPPQPPQPPQQPNAAQPPPRPQLPRVKRAAPPPPAPAGPKPDVKLLLDAPTTHGPWTMRVVNDGDIPVRLVADARLLTIEVTPRGARKPVRCQLPADMRPSDDMERALVLPPKRSYSESFEPRLYCFGERELDSLEATSIVVARLGWPERPKGHGPHVVSPLEGVEPEVAPLAAIESAPVSLPDEPTTALMATAAPARPDDPDPVRLSLSSSRAVDAATAENLSITVTVHNEGKRPVRLRFRPETLGFEVTSSTGVQRCGWPTPPSAPTREVFSTLPAGGAESLTVLLGDYCARTAFEHAGLVVVRPDLDTRQGGGEPLGFRTFDGVVIAAKPTVVRLHQGTSQLHVEHPRLDPEK